MGATWVLSAPDGPHIDPVNLAIMDGIRSMSFYHGGYPVNRNVRYGSHNMAAAEPGKKKLWP